MKRTRENMDQKRRSSSEENPAEIFRILSNEDDDSIFAKTNLPPANTDMEEIDIFAVNEDLEFYHKSSDDSENEDENNKLKYTQKFLQNFNSTAVLTGSDVTSSTPHAVKENPNIIPEKGPFFNLPVKVKHLIKEYKGIDQLYDWQIECLNLPAIKSRGNLIYALPTSGGKTLVSEILMLKEIVCREKNVIFIVPYVAIVQEKCSALAPFALSLKFDVEEYAGGKGKCPPQIRSTKNTLFICSIEKGAILFNSLMEADRANEIGLVVVDELHLLGEKGRGAVLEILLSKVIFCKADIQIVGMSATIGNLYELASFLKADVYTREFRPVELKEYLKCGQHILSVEKEKEQEEECDIRFELCRTVDYKYTSSMKKMDPDNLGGLVSEVTLKNSCLIFCPTRKSCENVAILLTKVLLKKSYIEYRKQEKKILLDFLQNICGYVNPMLAETIPFGIAFHHCGLLLDERKLLEIAFRIGTLCVICCTSTLAAGVNLPAKRVIIRSPYVGSNFISLSQYKQMIGRAGRAGFGQTGESIMIVSKKDNDEVKKMLSSPMNNVISTMLDKNFLGLENLLMNAIGLQMSTNVEELTKLASSTLLGTQQKTFAVNIAELVPQRLKSMLRKKVVQIVDVKLNTTLPTQRSIITCQAGCSTQSVLYSASTKEPTPKRKLVLSLNTVMSLNRTSNFELTVLGKGAFKAGISFDEAERINVQLELALKSLVLSDYSHLLYLLVVVNKCSETNIKADPTILYTEYNSLSESAGEFFKVIGVTEPHAIKMFKTQSLEGQVEVQLQRLYVVFILNDLIKLLPLHEVAAKYHIECGEIQNLLVQSSASANIIIRLCEEIKGYWCYKPLLETINEMLHRYTSSELQPSV